jgi:hypothetical protein
MPQAGL